MRFSSEDDVGHYFIARFLEILGYDVPGEAPVEKKLPFKIASAGRQRIKLKRPDFLVQTNGRALLVIETKAPDQAIDADAIEQALSYARHEDVRAPLTMLANGRRVLILESDTRHRLLDIEHADLAFRYRDLHLLLAKETLGSTIAGHIRLEKRVGRGAFGTVYKAFNLRLKRAEAVKIYTFDATEREARRRRFRQGMVAQARLDHPNIATVFGEIEYGSELAVRMQFIDGQSIDQWIKKSKPSMRERVLLLAKVAETIQFAHERGVVHRDLKPSNILVTEGSRPVIVDFDTAVVLGESTITQSADRLGAFGYIDPEMLDVRSHKKPRDARSDIYSLGRVLEYMLTGEHPRQRPARDLDTRIRGAMRALTSREQNLLFDVLLSATADKREERTQTAAAFASDLHAIFDEEVRGDRNAMQYAEAVFEEFDEMVAAGQMPIEWQHITSRTRPDEFGRYSPLAQLGELALLYDKEFYSFYIGPVIADADTFERFKRSSEFRKLRAIFGRALRVDPNTQNEDGSANLVIRYFDVRKEAPREIAARFAQDLRRFLQVLDPPSKNRVSEGRAEAPVAVRDIVSEAEHWQRRPFGARQAFKKLAREVREADAVSYANALMPFLHLLWPEARFSPELALDGIHIIVGSPVAVAIHCSDGGIRSTRAAVERFRQSRHSVRDFIVIINREEQTKTFREELKLSLDRILGEGKAERALVWNHRDDVIYAAFELMSERVRGALDRWNNAMFEEQEKIERAIGGTPIGVVPLNRSRVRIDATSVRMSTERPVMQTADVVDALRHDDKRLLHLILGHAGLGKTTVVMRAARERALRWLVIPAAKLRRDAANAQTLFETAIDFEVMLSGATETERPIWQRIVGPVVKYLTQFRSGLGIIVDALDESTVIGTSYGLQTFFNLFRRTVVPVVITMRTDFWLSRSPELKPGKSAVESTVQTLEVIELLPWTDRQIIEAARLRLATVRPRLVRERIEAFIASVESGEYERFYGDIPRTPLFLRFILDVLDRRDPRHMNRSTIMQYWAELKILRDVDAPHRRGGSRLPIRRDRTTARDVVALSRRTMIEAAAAMTDIRGDVVELLPDCSFATIRDRMGDDAPDSAESLALNSLLITTSAEEPRLRFAHRLFQEYFLAQAAPRFAGKRLPESVLQWVPPTK